MPELHAISRGIRGQTEAVRAIAAEQYGVVSRAQLLASGVSRWAIDRAVRSGRLHRLRPGVYSLPAPTDLKRTLRRGHPGSANLRAALIAHAPGHGTVKSQLERKFRRLLIKHQIPLPFRNQQLGPWTVDCLSPNERLVVELDGRQHTRPARATRDDDRDLWLRRHGYTIRPLRRRRRPAQAVIRLGQPPDPRVDLLRCHA